MQEVLKVSIQLLTPIKFKNDGKSKKSCKESG
jgi:hypothetical protein